MSTRLVQRNGWRVTWSTGHPKDSAWARFGGGWQWELGVQVSRSKRTVIVNLLVGYLRIELPRARLGASTSGKP